MHRILRVARRGFRRVHELSQMSFNALHDGYIPTALEHLAPNPS
jgi:hypothetical protein